MLRFLPVSIPARRTAHSLLAMGLTGLSADPFSNAAAAEVSFNRDIRPILSENCYSCHGPDKRARKAERRIDNAEGAYAEHEGARAFAPGDLAKSDAWARVNTVDPDDQMPPSKSGKKLTPEQIALLKKWIEEGAKYESHWSFIPPKRPEVPPMEDRKAEIRNPIDAFLLARLAKDGLTFSPEAEKTTLIRRATYDLTGLPPTPAEVDAFLADPSANAYGKLIDRLLASPLYGEKMAVHWLDLARYADTHGYHLDAGRDQWPWRDWVISAFNRNVPFNQFVEWQLAGDLLPDATTEQKLATGFVRNNMINFEGGAIPEEYLAAYIKDRVNTTGTVFLGLTVGCAECHDHKFDPFTQRDFYQLYAYFNSVPENGLDGSKGNASPLLQLPATAEQAKKIEDLTIQIAAAEKHLAELGTQTDAAQTAWEKTLTDKKPAEWTVLKPDSARADGGTELAVQPDGSLLAHGANPATNVYEITARSDGSLAGLRLEALTDPSLSGQGPGRASNGNFVMSGIELAVAPAGKPEAFAAVKLVRAQADYEQANYSVAGTIDADSKSGWAVDGNVRHENRTAWFEAEKPVGFPGGTLVRVRLRFESPVGTHAIGRPRLAVTGDTPVIEQTKLPADLSKILALPESQRDEGQRKKLKTHYREKVSPVLREPAAQLAKLREEIAAAKKRTPNVMVMQQMEKPRDTFILTRGQYDQHGEKVQPAVPASLAAQAPDAPKNRLGLARWLTDSQHPLMARVSVNRFWKNIMGTGIVKTVNDFGSQGEWPKHPELLDWLAVEFRESGWDVKHLVRLIVTSTAYRQTARVTPELLERDPDNRLLGRGPRFRLGAEEVRDTALAVSGLLTKKIGGPSVLPYQPAGLWEDLNSRTDSKNWSAQFFVQSHGEDLYRRSLYTFWKRTSPPPQMLTFDAPDREVCTANRERTNTPLQALVTLNDPQFVEASRKFAERMMREGGGTSADRVKFAFRIATSRIPGERELTMLLSLFEKAKVRYAAQPEQAMKLLSAGEAKRDETLDVTELAAWTMVASTILNLDETITKG